MKRDTGGLELGAQSPIKTQRDFRFDRGTECAVPGHRDEERLDAAIQIAAIDVEQSHYAQSKCGHGPRSPASVNGVSTDVISTSPEAMRRCADGE